jgi:diguanylate cyclase (GGDEF)-like protein/PAS domain S-box-containing protein
MNSHRQYCAGWLDCTAIMFENFPSLWNEHAWAGAVAGVASSAAICAWLGKAARRRLRERAWFLETAVNKMTQGLTMFDSAGRLVLCNRRYIEMYGLSPDVVKPGCTVGQLVDHRIKTGSLTVEQADRYVTHRQAAIGEENSVGEVFELPDGRTIVVTRRPLSGGGWVATHDDITERRRAEAQIAYMIYHDALTDLPNRVLLRDKLDAALVRIRRGEQLAVLCIDIDYFKGINDSLGHSVGDQLLKLCADRLRTCLRETDMLARLGGDEFAIIQTGIKQPSDPATLARRIRETITAPCQLGRESLIADVSIGIAVAPNDGSDCDQLLHKADMALYGSKSEGRGTFRFFEAEMDARVKTRRTLELDLRMALANDQFELYYQPLVDLQRNEISACEALLRWHHPRRGIILPDEFIPVAEEMGLIGAIGEWVLKAACAEAATWPRHVAVAVNVSPVQFKEHTIALMVASALAAAGLSARQLEIEITEAVLMRENEATLATLHQLRELGVRIVMDDFGTGYSSLSYLRSFPFDKIKIDRSFIKDVADKEDATAIVEAVTSLAARLNITTVAEGVETEAQLEKSRALGCTEIQGHLFSPPKPAREIARLFNPSDERVGAA